MSNDTYFERKILVHQLQLLKKEKQFTYQKIGEEIGVDRSHLYRIFNNPQASVSLNLLIEIARFLQVPFYHLFFPVRQVAVGEFLIQVKAALEGRCWDIEELATRVEMEPKRLRSLLQGEVELKDVEAEQIGAVLEVAWQRVSDRTDQLHQLQINLEDAGVPSEKRKAILEDILGMIDEQAV